MNSAFFCCRVPSNLLVVLMISHDREITRPAKSIDLTHANLPRKNCVLGQTRKSTKSNDLLRYSAAHRNVLSFAVASSLSNIPPFDSTPFYQISSKLPVIAHIAPNFTLLPFRARLQNCAVRCRNRESTKSNDLIRYRRCFPRDCNLELPDGRDTLRISPRILAASPHIRAVYPKDLELVCHSGRVKTPPNLVR